jgi:hypothetical protein
MDLSGDPAVAARALVAERYAMAGMRVWTARVSIGTDSGGAACLLPIWGSGAGER